MRKIKFWGFPFQIFLFIIYCFIAYHAYKGVIYRIPDSNSFTIIKKYSYTDIHKYSSEEKYKIICTNRFGKYDMSINYDAFSSYNIGDKISFEKCPRVGSLLFDSLNDNTKNNILTETYWLYRPFYSNPLYAILFWLIFAVYSFFELIIIAIPFIIEFIRKIFNKIFNFD